MFRLWSCGWLVLAAALGLMAVQPGPAYVEAALTLGDVIRQSTNIVLMQVIKVDRERNLIIYKKIRDIKGVHPQDIIKHNIGRNGFRPSEWQDIMNWAEVGKLAVFFHNGGASETYYGHSWYQAYAQGEWWGMSHGEPYLLRSYAGKVEKLPAIVEEILAGKEVIVPCLVDGDKEALHKRTARVQRLRASLKLLDYNPKRDFVGWGAEEIRRLEGMPGFDRYAALPNLQGEVQSVTAIDFNNDGKIDICLCGGHRVALLQNDGDSFVEVNLPHLSGGARAAVWADYNGDGLPDLLLATTQGPKLYTNLGGSKFRDDSRLLPAGLPWHTTAAAWGDFDGDGKPDILLACGYHGLRLLRNNRPADAVAKTASPKWGDWYAIGPFRHGDGSQNFDTKFSPENEPFDLKKVHKGKRDLPIQWTKKNFTDGTVNSLAEYGQNCATYLYREVEVPLAVRLPVSLGSDDTLTVWLNGQKIINANVQRACAPDQNIAELELRPGKNVLLIKVCNYASDHAFFFAPREPHYAGEPWFQDVSTIWGLGPDGIGSHLRGDALIVADFDGDDRPDALYAAGKGLLLLNTGNRLAHKIDSGLQFTCGGIGPIVWDYNGDGRPDLFVPQRDGQCRLFRNAGGGRFIDVTASAGDLNRPIEGAVAAAAADFNNDGRPDLIVCCLRGINRYFENSPAGVFTDRTAVIGFHQRLFNSQAATLADLDGDGRLDVIFVNDRQESCVLFGRVGPANGQIPMQVSLNGTPAAGGGRVAVRDAAGQLVAACNIPGGHGRGGQCGLVPRFLLPPGTYTVEWISTNGHTHRKTVTLANAPLLIRGN